MKQSLPQFDSKLTLYTIKKSLVMFKLFFIVFVLTEYLLANTESLDMLLISSFFKNKNIGSVILVICSEKALFKEYLTELDFTHTQRILLSAKENIPVLYPTLNSQHYRTGVYFDFTCSSTKKMSDEMLFNMSYTVLIYSEDYNKTIEFLQESTISFDSDLTLSVNSYFYDLYRIKFSYPIISNVMGVTDNSTILYKKLKKRDNLDSAIINSGLVWTGGFPFKDTAEGIEQLLDFTYEPESEFLTRYSYNIHHILETAYNFRMNLTVYDDWGYFNEELKIWDKGMFQGIDSGEIDLGISICRIFGQRLDISLYFPPFLKFRTCFIFKHPSMLAEHTALIEPLTSGSWLCTLSILLLSSAVICYIRSFSIEDVPPNELDFAASLVLALGTFCQQGLMNDSFRLSVRVLYTFLLITSLLVYLFYGAAVVGFLLLPSPRTINTVEKLIDSPITVFAENLMYHKTHFQGNFSEKAARAYKAIQDKKTNTERWIDLKGGIQKVKNGRAALYAQDTNLYRAIEKSFSSSDICTLTEIEIVLIWTSTVIRKRSPYKELLYRGMILTHENGLLHRVVKTWQAQRPQCLDQEESPTVSLEATVIAHVVYSVGLVLSLLILVLEIHTAKIKKNSLSKSRKTE